MGTPPRAARPLPPAPRVRTVGHVVLLALACALVYANTLEGGLHLDDHYRIGSREAGTANPELERVWPPWRHFLDPSTSTTLPQLEQYRPLLPLSLSVTHALSDALGLERLTGLHLGNVAAHLASCVLLYLLFRELLSRARGEPGRVSGGDASAAATAALLFAVHPVSGVPVNYLCARDLLLMQAFLAAALLAYVRLRRKGGTPLRWAAVLLLLALSLSSKTNALVAPGLVLAFELLLGHGSLRHPRGWLRLVPFAVLSAGFYAFTLLALDFSDLDQLHVERPPLEYPLTQAREHLTHYLRNAVAPFWLRPLPYVEPARGLGDPWVWAGLAAIGASLVLAWRLRRRAPLVSFCVLAYWVLMALTSSFVPLRSLATDYRQYPSLAFLCLGAVELGRRYLSRRVARAAAAAAVLYLALVGALHHNPVWRTEESLWGRSVGVGRGGTFRAHMNYGQSLTATRPLEAERHFRRALELSPGDVYTHINLGLLLLRLGRGEEGLASVRRAVDLAPSWAIARFWMGQALEQSGRRDEAAGEYARASDLEPANPRYAYHAALEASRAGNPEAVLRFTERLHGRGEPYRDSLFLEGFALQQLGRGPEAIDRYVRFLEREPDHAQVLFNLAYARMEAGEPREAIRLFERALAADPSRAEVHHWLAQCHEALGDAERAERARRRYREASGR